MSLLLQSSTEHCLLSPDISVSKGPSCQIHIPSPGNCWGWYGLWGWSVGLRPAQSPGHDHICMSTSRPLSPSWACSDSKTMDQDQWLMKPKTCQGPESVSGNWAFKRATEQGRWGHSWAWREPIGHKCAYMDSRRTDRGIIIICAAAEENIKKNQVWVGRLLSIIYQYSKCTYSFTQCVMVPSYEFIL